MSISAHVSPSDVSDTQRPTSAICMTSNSQSLLVALIVYNCYRKCFID